MKAETEPEEPIKTGEQGNTSMDTGVSSDLSESRPSLAGEEEEEDEDLSAGSAGESGGEFDSRRRSEEDSEEEQSNEDSEVDHRRTKRTKRRGGRKRQLATDEDHDGSGDSRRCHSIAKQRITIRQDGSVGSGDVDHQQQPHLKCPECGDGFSSTANLIHHVQMAHPATLARPPAAGGAGAKDLADIPSILHLANAAAAAAAAAGTTSSGRNVNNLFLNDEILTNPPEEYKNEEDDPFSAVLREMKIKGEFPCRLCDAVFPNLRALKGKKNCTNFLYFEIFAIRNLIDRMDDF